MIYFIQEGTAGLIKIGKANDPRKRLQEMQTGSAGLLVLLATAPGSRKEEGILHRRFKAHRSRGEWFRPAAELLAYIKTMGPPHSPTVAEELSNRNNCRSALQGVLVTVALSGDEVFEVVSSFWDRHSKLVLKVCPQNTSLNRFPNPFRADAFTSPAEDCTLVSEWPVGCRCWCPGGSP